MDLILVRVAFLPGSRKLSFGVTGLPLTSSGSISELQTSSVWS